LDTYFDKATSEYEEKALEEPYHSENCNKVSSQTDDAISDSQGIRHCLGATLRVLSLAKGRTL